MNMALNSLNQLSWLQHSRKQDSSLSSCHRIIEPHLQAGSEDEGKMIISVSSRIETYWIFYLSKLCVSKCMI